MLMQMALMILSFIQLTVLNTAFKLKKNQSVKMGKHYILLTSGMDASGFT
jgi:hypothetical protein